MFDHLRCPVCGNHDRQRLIGVRDCQYQPVPANIAEAGLNSVLQVVVKKENLRTKTFRCGSCQHFYLSPSFEPDEIARFYSLDMRSATSAGYRASEQVSGMTWAQQHGIDASRQNALIEQGRVERRQRLADILSAGGIKHMRSVLDVGGMDGSLLVNLPATQKAVYDLCPIPEGNPDIEFISSWADLERRSGFDLIIMSHVLEHQPLPTQFLRDYSSRVADGGWVYVEVPMEYLSPYLKRRGCDIGGHVNMFTGTSLRRALAESGFQTVQFQSGLFPYGEMRIPIIKALARKVAGGIRVRSRRGTFITDLGRDLWTLFRYRRSIGRVF